jgi:hypothetical protein
MEFLDDTPYSSAPAPVPGGLPSGAKVVQAGDSWVVLEYEGGMQTIRFKASEATQTESRPAIKGGRSGSPETEAYITPEGKVFVAEGIHRLNAVAVEGETVAESVDGAPGWLEYTFKGATEQKGIPPGWGQPLNKPGSGGSAADLEGYDW